MTKIRIALAVAAAAVGLFALVLVGSTFPRESGDRTVAGLTAPLTIETGARGVPTVRAKSREDALFGLGYAHARDRLWQLEYQRRIGAGTLAEILGPRLVDTDRFLRTIGFRRAAESAWRRLAPPTRRRIEAYVAGINAYLATGSARPIEFRILRVTPARFEPVDSLVWAKLMAWDLAGNARNEIRRERFAAAVGEKRAAELLPPAAESPTILEGSEWKGGDGNGARLSTSVAGIVVCPRFLARLDRAFALAGAREPDDAGLGSNSWVLAGSRTTTGRPILANDPHLALRTPSVWYLARLEAPGLSVAGATLPGLPGVVIGANASIAWALTSLEPDVQDLFVEETDPADPTRYLWRGGWRRFDVRRERIRVRGAEDVLLDVRSTVHGPIVSDAFDIEKDLGPAVALRWTALDDSDSTAESLDGINVASDWHEFLAAVRLFHAPAQNFLYADATGRIGYTASGSIPVRPRSNGTRPASGGGDDDWTGYVPFDAMPRVVDPPRGYIVTANNRVVPAGSPIAITADWPEPYRARRITQRIEAKVKLSVGDVRSMQGDVVSLQATDLLPLLLDTVPADPASTDALERLRSWNREFAGESPAAAIYAAWYSELAKMPLDELGATPLGGLRSRFLMRALQDDAAWCDDVTTRPRENCAALRSKTLAAAVAFLRRRLGEEPVRWRWDRLHVARLPHGVFDAVPGLRALFSLEARRGGDASTVDVGAYRLDGSFLMTDGPSYRQVVDFSRPGEMSFVHPTGQSGNVFDRRYRDLLPLWRKNEYLRAGPTAKTLRLEPE